jgi:uncharacterized protein YwgA
MEKTVEQQVQELKEKVKGLTAILEDLAMRFIDHVEMEISLRKINKEQAKNLTELKKLFNKHLEDHLSKKVKGTLKDQPVS